MGIDIYLCDHKLTDDESWYDQQRAYIRESYHGQPYPSSVYLPESYKSETRVTYEQLVHRLPKTIELAVERWLKVYNCNEDVRDAIEPYIKFLEEVIKIEDENKEAWVMNSY